MDLDLDLATEIRGPAADPVFDCKSRATGTQQTHWGSLSISTVTDLGVWVPSSITVSKEAEEVEVINCGVIDAEVGHSNGKVARMSEVGMLVFGMSEATM